jgi:hypothetical protein
MTQTIRPSKIVGTTASKQPESTTMTAKKATTVATIQPQAIAQQAVHPGAMIQALMAMPEVDIVKLEKMFELQTKFEENQARKAYHEAMAMFGALIPVLAYDSWVHFKSKDGKVETDYGFASLAGSMKKLQEAMDQCSLKATWKTETKGDSGYTQVTCFMTHALGHSESTSLSALPDPSGGKNSIQAVKSTVSYLKRITFEAIAGLATMSDDADDGANASKPPEFISAQQLRSITTKIAKVGADAKKILELFKCETLADLTVDQYAPAHALLAAKAAADKANKK